MSGVYQERRITIKRPNISSKVLNSKMSYVFPFIRQWFYDSYSEVKIIGMQIDVQNNSGHDPVCSSDFWLFPDSTDIALDLKLKFATSVYSVNPDIVNVLDNDNASVPGVEVFNATSIYRIACATVPDIIKNGNEALTYGDLSSIVEFYGVNPNDALVNFAGTGKRSITISLLFKRVDSVLSEKDSQILCNTVLMYIKNNPDKQYSLKHDNILPIATDIMSGIHFWYEDGMKPTIVLKYRKPEGDQSDIETKIDKLEKSIRSRVDTVLEMMDQFAQCKIDEKAQASRFS